MADEAERDLIVYLRRSGSGAELLIAVSFFGAENNGITVTVAEGRYRPIFCTHPGALASTEIDTDASGTLTFSLPPFGGIVFERIGDTVFL